MKDLVITGSGALVGDRFDHAIVDDFSGNEESKRAYVADLKAFGTHHGLQDPREALTWLLRKGEGGANVIAAAYRADMLERGELAAATINRRLSSLRRFVLLLKTFGKIDYELNVSGVRVRGYRDTRGPGVAPLRQLIEAARTQETKEKGKTAAKRTRDVAMIKLLFGLALRRSEVARLQLADWDVANACVWIKGKGKHDKAPMTLPPDVTAALMAWREQRGLEPGPLFINFRDGRSFTGDGIHYILQRLSAKAGLEDHVRPHGVRHTAITEALERSNGNYREVQKLSRHARADTVMIYDDNRQDVAGKMSTLISDALGDEE